MINIITALILTLLFLVSFVIPRIKKVDYGSARFDKRSSILKLSNKGVKIGFKSLSRKESYKHTILVAPTGSGKTQNLILKNVYHLSAKGNSLVINDPKMELWNLCSGWMQTQDMQVYVLNLQDINNSVSWNPFDALKPSEFQGLVTDMYDMVNKGSNTESIWRYGTIEMISLIAQVLHDSNEDLHLPNILQTIKQLQAFPKKTGQWMHHQTDDEETMLSIDRMLNQDEKIFHGIVSGAMSVMIPFTPSALLKIQTHTTLPSIADIRRIRSALFLALPIGKESTYAPFITLLLSRLFNDIINTPLNKTDKPLVFMLEEFAQLLPIPNYQSIISTVRSKKVMLFHCLQNLDQLTDRYDTSVSEIICNNCSHWIMLAGIKSNKTLTYIKESLVGITTFQGGKDNNDKFNGRPLMTKDEIRRLPANTALFVSANNLPVLIKMKPLYRSWWLKRKYNLRKDDGNLVSKLSPVKHTHASGTIKRINFKQAVNINLAKHLSFEEQLNQLLTTDEEE